MMCMSPGTSQDNRTTIAPTERHHLTCLAKYWLSSWWLLSTCREMMASDDRLSSRFSIASSVGKLADEDGRTDRSLSSYRRVDGMMMIDRSNPDDGGCVPRVLVMWLWSQHGGGNTFRRQRPDPVHMWVRLHEGFRVAARRGVITTWRDDYRAFLFLVFICLLIYFLCLF